MFAETKRAFIATQPVFWGIEPACLAFARISQVRSAASAACEVVPFVRPPEIEVLSVIDKARLWITEPDLV